ncbi:enoyl-CoA hydratase/isomerase family protein [Glaciimonas sp. CA11.2]|uniref:enoyl-CoA hydratase/isomerase family protein n=1 Tax=unclassified Glaciimonas TaxID=2644401 RepID=UPI002AB5A76A|nr:MULTISPECIES: enoyl-CoA hydratase/isomerase family protein [unclassified Glaciimonas]MDY7546875.1 enoyl-CoA hydratase/isomerase family protein [Glaciimonas sp. CA11.2]MEB0012344.1 enoyl-CoA hydratase/isomerase family protein [Glaciimonas sp. Cout2]MEB0080470.1 enoyl-CoA hydratase/isomerase family protein [Glaciimonas sp. Gout2]MEB0161917.1 enoyl-CoA hydratase/isomerase family protein [Glaciimonas sp. CA11.2]
MAIDFEVSDDGIALITINRPERLNAMDIDHYQGLSRAWCTVRDDPAIRVAIITGAGERSFTTGADIKSFVTAPAGISEMWLTQRDQLLNRGLEVWKPVVSAINGYCLGGGMTLMMATDIRLAAPHATFSLAEVKRGLIPGNGGTQRVLDQLPYPIAMEMLLTGDGIDAVAAERWGLINKIVPLESLLSTAYDYARRIAINAPLAVQAAKELAVRSIDMDLATGLRMEAVINRMLQTTEDAKEGPEAFSARRTPNFKGK